MLNTSAGNRLLIRICLAMHSWAFIGELIFSHVHNIHLAKCQDHTMTSLHLQRGMIKVWRVERTRQSVCRPSNEESSTCPWTVVLLPARYLRSMRSPTPQHCTLGRWHCRLLAQTARCCCGGLKTLMSGLDNSRHWSESGTRSPSLDQVPRKLSAWKNA